MIISDLQYIESVETSDVQGGGRKHGHYPKVYKKYTRAYSAGELDIIAVGDKTSAEGYLELTADADAGISAVYANGYASASSKKYYFKW
jgi:hypothetical protein